MSMSLKQAAQAVLLNTRAGNATMLVSPSGYGKSTMLMACFEKLRAENAKKGRTTGLGVIFAATQTPPDLIGYQFKGERTFPLPAPVKREDGTMQDKITVTVTDPSVPLWMLDVFTGKPASMFDQFVLMIEEYGQGDPDTKKACAEIFLRGGTAPWYLPEGSARWGCSNSGSRYGVTKDFLFTISRRTLINIHPEVDELVDHWDNPYWWQGRTWQMSPVWKAWAKSTGKNVIFEPEPKEDGPWCNPRTMASADRIYQCIREDNGGKDPDSSDSILLDMFAGTIGMPATQACLQHLLFRVELPPYEEVVADPLNAPLPTKGDLQMLMAYEMANSVKPDHIAACLTYINRLNKDMGQTFMLSLLRREYRGFINQPALQAWISKNGSKMALLAGIAQQG